MGLLLIRYALGGVLPMRDVAFGSYVWGSRIGANEMRMHTNGIKDEKPMMATRDFKPGCCVMATCRAGSPNPAACVAGTAAFGKMRTRAARRARRALPAVCRRQEPGDESPGGKAAINRRTPQFARTPPQALKAPRPLGKMRTHPARRAR